MTEPAVPVEFSIGDVVRLLAAEHEGLTASSLRFLEREGLITPARTEGGHRRYSAADVNRIRFIKKMQQRFFPVSLIRELLRKADSDRPAGGKRFFRALNHESSFERLSDGQLAAVAELEPDAIRSLGSLGLLGSATGLGNDEDDLRIAQVVGELRRFGLDVEDSGFIVPHMEAMVDEEMELIVSKVMARRSLDETDAALMQVEELWDELRRVLHAKFLRARARAMAETLREEFEGKL